MAQAERRSKAIEFRFVVTTADLSGDSELQSAKLDDRAGILLTLPWLTALGFQGDLPGHSGFRDDDKQLDPANARPLRGACCTIGRLCALDPRPRGLVVWSVRYRHGTGVEGKAGTFATTKSAAVAATIPLTSHSCTAGTALTAAPSPQAS